MERGERRGVDTPGGEQHVKVKAETGVGLLQAKDPQAVCKPPDTRTEAWDRLSFTTAAGPNLPTPLSQTPVLQN